MKTRTRNDNYLEKSAILYYPMAFHCCHGDTIRDFWILRQGRL